MNFLRKLLFPLGGLYWLVTFIRNWLYDLGIFPSKSYELTVIASEELTPSPQLLLPFTVILIGNDIVPNA
jgi:tetraacyldisaccharide 4'-kinase